MALSFTWDRRKAATNLKKHSLFFEEAATAFGDPLSGTIVARIGVVGGGYGTPWSAGVRPLVQSRLSGHCNG